MTWDYIDKEEVISMVRWLLGLASASLALTACGSDPVPGSQQGEQGAREVAAAWYSAVAANSGDTACSFMTGSMRSKVINAARATTCEDALRIYGETLDDQAEEAIKAKDFRLRMKGEGYASVELNTTTRADTFAITWYASRWMLSDVVE